MSWNFVKLTHPTCDISLCSPSTNTSRDIDLAFSSSQRRSQTSFLLSSAPILPFLNHTAPTEMSLSDINPQIDPGTNATQEDIKSKGASLQETVMNSRVCIPTLSHRPTRSYSKQLSSSNEYRPRLTLHRCICRSQYCQEPPHHAEHCRRTSCPVRQERG